MCKMQQRVVFGLGYTRSSLVVPALPGEDWGGLLCTVYSRGVNTRSNGVWIVYRADEPCITFVMIVSLISSLSLDPEHERAKDARAFLSDRL